MGAIEEVYADLDADVSEAEFREAVEAKIEQMGGLADEKSAAMLVAHEVADNEVNAIADIETGMEEVKFVAKVLSIGELRTFERDGEDEDGRVVNVEAGDETGVVRLAFWDEQATAAVEGELDVGDVLRIKGRPKDGYNGLEVSVDKAEPDEDTQIDVEPGATTTVDSLTLGQSEVSLQGLVLGTDSVRTFDRDDGSEGRVANLTLGDETGRVRVTLWDERAERTEEFEPGVAVEVVNGYVREREGDLELHVGDEGTVEEIDAEISYEPDATPIDTVEIDRTVDLSGVVRSTDPKRTFDRDDGSEGQVKNVRIQDETGDIRVALWGDLADMELQPGDEVLAADVEIQDGWQDDLEASANWASTVTVLEDAASPMPAGSGGGDGPGAGAPGSGDGGPAADNGGSERAAGGASLDSFADGTQAGAAGGGQSEAAETGTASASIGKAGVASGREGQEAEAATDGKVPNEAQAENEGAVEFTGTVVQTGDPVVLDDGSQTVTVETDERLQLGEEVTVRGPLADGRVDADDVF